MMVRKFCTKYKLPEKLLFELLSHTTEVQYPKGTLVIKEGERNANFYLLKQGFWRAYYLKDGTENSLWFIGPGEIAFSSWGYVNGESGAVAKRASQASGILSAHHSAITESDTGRTEKEITVFPRLPHMKFSVSPYDTKKALSP